MKRLLMLAGATLVFTACAESPTAPTASRVLAPSSANLDEFTCRSGYVVAYDENGNPYCVAQEQGLAAGGASGARPASGTPRP